MNLFEMNEPNEKKHQQQQRWTLNANENKDESNAAVAAAAALTISFLLSIRVYLKSLILYFEFKRVRFVFVLESHMTWIGYVVCVYVCAWIWVMGRRVAERESENEKGNYCSSERKKSYRNVKEKHKIYILTRCLPACSPVCQIHSSVCELL